MKLIFRKRRSGETEKRFSALLHFARAYDKTYYAIQPNDLVAMMENDLRQPRRKGGRWGLWLCQFHPDRKTPSLGANQENGSWYCFGIYKGGDVISWLREYRKLSYGDALAFLGVNQTEGVDTHHRVLENIQRKEIIGPSEIWLNHGREYRCAGQWLSRKAGRLKSGWSFCPNLSCSILSLSPSGKDITHYVQAGGDLWEWLKHQLVRIDTPDSL